MPKERPINAEVPPTKAPGKPDAPPPSRRKRVPAPLKLIVAAVLLAGALVAVVVIAGTGESERNQPAPAPEAGGSPRDTDAPSAKAAEDLGYPGFATKNTTRVGGADPVANAAAVSLAAFPSTDEESHPDAVTLVNEDDWRVAIAASVLVAEPIGAPVLLSGTDGVPDATEAALRALEPAGSRATRGAQAFAIGEVAGPGDLRTTAVRGSGDAALAAGVARLRDRLVKAPPHHIVIASANRPGFAMPAAGWAARSGDPVLFSNRDRLPPATVAALKRHPKAPVFVLGPPSAISSKAMRQIPTADRRVHRVSGKSPVANAIALARYDRDGFGWNINDPGHGFVVARADSPLEAAAAAPLSASGTWGPLLLTSDAATLPLALRDYLLDVKPGYSDNPTRAFYNHVWVIGDQEAIDVTQQGEIDGLAELTKIGSGP